LLINRKIFNIFEIEDNEIPFKTDNDDDDYKINYTVFFKQVWSLNYKVQYFLILLNITKIYTNKYKSKNQEMSDDLINEWWFKKWVIF
jgi:hypothetical protein